MKKTMTAVIFSVLFLGLVSTAQAAVLDLSLVTASGTINSALFSRFAQTGQGSGNFDPFVRLQDNGTQSGYNTDGVVQFDTKDGVFTHAVQLSQIPLVNIGGIDYRELILDAAEPGNGGNTLNLNTMELYLLNSGSISSYPFSESPLFTLGSNSILLNNIVGNGTADMYAYIPDSIFLNDNDKYFYLYSSFENAGGSFEEWGWNPKAGTSTTPTPEPATMMLFGMGLAGMGLLRRKNLSV